MEKLQIIVDRIWKTMTLVLLIGELGSILFVSTEMMVVYSLAILIGGFLTYFVASEYKNRKGIWPFLYGAVWGLWAIIYYLLAKRSK